MVDFYGRIEFQDGRKNKNDFKVHGRMKFMILS